MITHVAILHQGKLWSLPKPYRHHHVIRKIAAGLGVDMVDGAQGFLDSDGRYLTRRQALAVAQANDQLIHQERPSSATKLGELYSEDLW